MLFDRVNEVPGGHAALFTFFELCLNITTIYPIRPKRHNLRY